MCKKAQDYRRQRCECYSATYQSAATARAHVAACPTGDEDTKVLKLSGSWSRRQRSVAQQFELEAIFKVLERRGANATARQTFGSTSNLLKALALISEMYRAGDVWVDR